MNPGTVTPEQVRTLVEAADAALDTMLCPNCDEVRCEACIERFGDTWHELIRALIPFKSSDGAL